jgi:hypothetical protein
MRLHVQQSFLEAFQDGRLSNALKEVKTETLRCNIRSTLVNAGSDGRLAKAVAKGAQKEMGMEALRRDVRAAVVIASKDGRLADALQKAEANRAQQEESARMMAKAMLQQSGQDGRLADAFQSVDRKLQRHVQPEYENERPIEVLVSDSKAAVDISATPAMEMMASPSATKSKRRIIGGISRTPSKPALELAAPAFVAKAVGVTAAGGASNAVKATRTSKTDNLEMNFKNMKKLPEASPALDSYKPSTLAAARSSGHKMSAAMLDLGVDMALPKKLRPVTPSNRLMKSASSGAIPLKVTNAPLGLLSIGTSIAGFDLTNTLVAPSVKQGPVAWGSRMGRRCVSLASFAAPVF